jgi:hypothetical protein
MKNSLIEKVKGFFKAEFESLKFATATLLDGTVVSNNEETQEFEVGQYLYIQKESTLTPAPEGKHETTEGFVLEVDAAGQIVAIYEKEDEREGESEADRVSEDVNRDDEEELKKLIKTYVATLAEINKRMEKLSNEFKEFRMSAEKEPVHKPSKSVKEVSDRSEFKLKLIRDFEKLNNI